MYKCEMCDSIFSDPDRERVCMEDYFGVGSMFPNRNYDYIYKCPYCGSEEIDSYWEEKDLDEELLIELFEGEEHGKEEA